MRVPACKPRSLQERGKGSRIVLRGDAHLVDACPVPAVPRERPQCAAVDGPDVGVAPLATEDLHQALHLEAQGNHTASMTRLRLKFGSVAANMSSVSKTADESPSDHNCSRSHEVRRVNIRRKSMRWTKRGRLRRLVRVASRRRPAACSTTGRRAEGRRRSAGPG